MSGQQLTGWQVPRTFSIDGQSYGLWWATSNTTRHPLTRETLIGQDGGGARLDAEKPMAPHMSGTIRNSQGLTVADFNTIDRASRSPASSTTAK